MDKIIIHILKFLIFKLEYLKWIKKISKMDKIIIHILKLLTFESVSSISHDFLN